MGQTTILDETIDQFNSDTGEITSSVRRTVKKSRVEPTDEFVKVSKYLNLIFAYNNIPLTLVPISLLFAQRMEFKTNVLYLLKDDKEEIATMLSVGLERVKTLITECKKYDIIRPTNTRGKFVVNSFLFSTGSLVETRHLQAHFDLDSDAYIAQADQRNLITGETVRKTVLNKEKLNQIPGQLSFLP
mgnify:CR=1 FL=1